MDGGEGFAPGSSPGWTSAKQQRALALDLARGLRREKMAFARLAGEAFHIGQPGADGPSLSSRPPPRGCHPPTPAGVRLGEATYGSQEGGKRATPGRAAPLPWRVSARTLVELRGSGPSAPPDDAQRPPREGQHGDRLALAQPGSLLALGGPREPPLAKSEAVPVSLRCLIGLSIRGGSRFCSPHSKFQPSASSRRLIGCQLTSVSVPFRLFPVVVQSQLSQLPA